MNPEREYLLLVTDLLKEIKLKSLGLPKNPTPPEHMEMGYFYQKPHGVEFWLKPSGDYILQRNIIYKLKEEGILNVLDETRDDYGYDGTRFIVKLNDTFESFYKLHEKGERISKKLEDGNHWVQANFQDEEIHLFIGEKKDEDGKHVHIILGKTGEVRVDPKDENPAALLEQVLAITTKEGKTIRAELSFKKDS